MSSICLHGKWEYSAHNVSHLSSCISILLSPDGGEGWDFSSTREGESFHVIVNFFQWYNTCWTAISSEDIGRAISQLNIIVFICYLYLYLSYSLVIHAMFYLVKQILAQTFSAIYRRWSNFPNQPCQMRGQRARQVGKTLSSRKMWWLQICLAELRTQLLPLPVARSHLSFWCSYPIPCEYLDNKWGRSPSPLHDAVSTNSRRAQDNWGDLPLLEGNNMCFEKFKQSWDHAIWMNESCHDVLINHMYHVS